MPAIIGVRAIAAETGLDAWKIAVLAREGYTQIIWTLVMVEQRRRRRAAARFD
jgi:hypothetical protein